MKRRIIKVTASEKVSVNQLIDNISDEEFNKMSKAEKRIIAKAKLSPHPDIYLAGAADAIELTGASVTDAFIDFYNRVIENWKFDNDEVTSASDVDNSNQNLLDLAGDMLYQTYDNSPECSLDEAYDSVLDHVIMIITQMDDDGTYAEYLGIADYDNEGFTSMIRQYVEDHYDDYAWDL